MSLESRVKQLETKVKKLERSLMLSNIEPLITTSRKSSKSVNPKDIIIRGVKAVRGTNSTKPDFDTILEGE